MFSKLCSKLFDIGLIIWGGGYVSSGKGNKSKKYKWDYIKLKSFAQGRKSTKQQAIY